MNFVDEKAFFFFHPFWQYITSKTKGWSAHPLFDESSAFSLMKFCPYSSMKLHPLKIHE
jgi:hypothetical protein